MDLGIHKLSTYSCPDRGGGGIDKRRDKEPLRRLYDIYINIDPSP